MLTFEKILKVFQAYLDDDPLYEVVQTSHGYTLMAWEPHRNDWYSAEIQKTPEDLRNALLSTYANFLEDKITGNDRELTVTETGEIQQRCRELLEKCREPLYRNARRRPRLCVLLLLRSLFHFERPVYGTFDNRQVFFRAKLQLMADPLPLCAFFPHDLRVKISLYGKSADLNQLDHHRQARNRTLILNVGKIPPFNPNHFCQCFSCQTLCLSCGFDIRTEGFKTGTIFNFRHITSPGYIV